MGAIVFTLVCLVVITLLCVLGHKAGKAQYHTKEPWWACLEMPAGITAGVLVIPLIVLMVNSIAYINTSANLEAIQEHNRVQGAVYGTLIQNYDEMRTRDVTASETYMKLYDEIISFNKAVAKAEKWGDTWWAEGLFYDPGYLNVERVDLTVG